MSRSLVALLGATASGKTAAAVAVARRLPVEVVSADSRQLRCEMRIGTAAADGRGTGRRPPPPGGHRRAGRAVDAGRFLRHAREALEEIWERATRRSWWAGADSTCGRFWRAAACPPCRPIRSEGAARGRGGRAGGGGGARSARGVRPCIRAADRCTQPASRDPRAGDRGGDRRPGAARAPRAPGLRVARGRHSLAARGALRSSRRARRANVRGGAGRRDTGADRPLRPQLRGAEIGRLRGGDAGGRREWSRARPSRGRRPKRTG